MFKKNVGRLDGTIRLIAGGALILIGLLLFAGSRGGSTGVDVAIFGVALMMTGFFKFCMFYALFGLSTKEKGSI